MIGPAAAPPRPKRVARPVPAGGNGLALITRFAWNLVAALLLIVTVAAVAHLPILAGGRVPSGAHLSTNAYLSVLGAYLSRLAAGDLGLTRTGQPVLSVIATYLPRSLVLFAAALLLAVLAGIPKGISDCLRRRRFGSTLPLVGTLLTVSLPDIMVIVLAQTALIFLAGRGIAPLPASGAGTWRHLILPGICLAFIPGAYLARVTATSLDMVLDEFYVRTARGKGCTERRVIWRHAFRNALIQILDAFPGVAGMTFSNLLVVEYFFAYDGAGLRLLLAAERTEPNLLAGLGLGFAGSFALLFVSLQALRRVADPRLREGHQA